MNNSPDALPKPKDERKFPTLLGLSKKQTYKLIMYIPTFLLGLYLVFLLLTWTDWYRVNHGLLVDICQVSLIACLPLWYLKWIAGFCKGYLLSVYTIVVLNIINISYYFFKFDYHILYGLIVAFVGMILSGIFNKK